MIKLAIAFGIFGFIMEHPFLSVILVILLGVIGFFVYSCYQGQQNQQNQPEQSNENNPPYNGVNPKVMKMIVGVIKNPNVANTSMYNWENPESMKRIGWFLDPDIFDNFRISGLTAKEILEAHNLTIKLLDYKAGKDIKKLSLTEEERLWKLLNKAEICE